MKSEVQKEINKLLQSKHAFEEARAAYMSQFEVVRDIIKCPVCPNGNGKLDMSFGSFEIKCDCCGFHVGRSEDLKELLDRWSAVCDVIEETKKDKLQEDE